MLNDDVEWCPLEDFPSLEDVLKTAFKASGQLIKRHEFSSKFLSKKVIARECLKLPLTLVNHGQIRPLSFHGPRIITETKDFLALHKPPGVHTHPLTYEVTPNLVGWLAGVRPELLRVNQEGMDRGCLWRLDQETSGLILYAKTSEKHQECRKNFSQAFRRKLYVAIVEGNLEGEETLGHHFFPSGAKGSKMKIGSHPDAREGKLSYVSIETSNDRSLVLVNLETGLRHQIRAQLAHLGHPIVGDELYGAQKSERLFLHCLRYETDAQAFEDTGADLFDRFFNLNRLLQVIHNKLR